MTTFPIKTKFYMYAQDGDGSKLCDEYKLPEGAAENAYHVGHQVTFDVELYEDGTIIATHVNGVALVRGIEL